METCVGCGAQAEKHPMVGIGRENPETDQGQLVSHPVCDLCWRDPAHRKTQLKCHFHYRSAADVGLAVARLVDERSKRGEDLNLG